MNTYTISFKIVFIGNSGVGKTSIIKYYERFNKTQDKKISFNVHNSTIGVDYISITNELVLNDGNIVNTRLVIWDTGGQEQFNSICKVYYRDVSTVIIVYDATNYTSMISIEKWVKEVQSVNLNPNLVYVIIENKSDLLNKSMDDLSIKCKQILNELNLTYIFYKTSVKNNNNITNCFDELLKILVDIFFNKYNINNSIIDLNKINIDNFSEYNNGINLFKTNNQEGVKNKCCSY
jgi:small GTP-binding protein